MFVRMNPTYWGNVVVDLSGAELETVVGIFKKMRGVETDYKQDYKMRYKDENVGIKVDVEILSYEVLPYMAPVIEEKQPANIGDTINDEEPVRIFVNPAKILKDDDNPF